MYAIKSKENFNQEVAGLINKIQHQIDTYSNAVNTKSNLNTKGSIEKINTLKKYEFLIKEIPSQLVEMNHEDWEIKKEGLHKTFHQAHDALSGIITEAT